MSEKKKPFRVFLCHAHRDASSVHDLYLRLTGDGIDAWLDKEKLLPGSNWEHEIAKGVREADVVIICLSKHFNQSGFRQKEVRLALDTAMEKPDDEIFIIPARLEECDTLESLKQWHWVDFFETNGYEQLLRALQLRANQIGVKISTPKKYPTVNALFSLLSTKLFQKKHRRWLLGGLSILLILLIKFSSLYQFYIQPLLSPQTPAAGEQCMQPDSTFNTYLVEPEIWVREIYGHAANSDPTFKEQHYKEARYAAFQILGKLAKRWSDYVDISLPGSENIRVTITYISPPLIEAIRLNQTLADRQIGSSDDWFTESIRMDLDNVARRGETVFLVSITSTHYGNNIAIEDVYSVQIPIQEMTLSNALDFSVVPNQSNTSFNQVIPLTKGSFSGYVTYQMAIRNGGECELLLDPSKNTSISIHTPSLTVNGVDYGPKTWIIKLGALMDMSTGMGLIDYTLPSPEPNFTVYISSSEAPTPLNIPASDYYYWDAYWQMMARYVWGQVTFTSSP